MKALQEFKAFAMKGNVVDMAVGVVIGAAFGKIVSSLVADILTPVLGVLVGGVDFTNLKVTLRDAILEKGAEKPAVTWNYGTFMQSIFDFLIIAWAIFLVVKLVNRLQRREPPPPPPPPPPAPEVELLREIRDELRALKLRA
jgi:large conductance mechanosensitive channel